MSHNVTGTDLFCGLGGSSEGARSVPGVHMRMAANHWQLAVEAHNANHPDTDHDCADISQVDPRRYPRTDFLWASPECTNHSQAKGRARHADATPDLFGERLPDEAAQRSRATMWDVVRFAEHHRYRAVIVENVVDAADWIMWPAWLHAMDCLGYDHRVVYANSMHAAAAGAPAPQSRDRLYVVFWRRGERRPDFDRWTRPAAWCPGCGELVHAVQAWKRPDRQRGRYRQQYVWRCPNAACRHAVVEPPVLPAAAAIDWSLPGTRIGDRPRPLAPKTLARIRAGLTKFAQPIHLEAAGNTFERRPGVRTWPLSEPLRTIHTTASKAAAVPPLLVPAGGTWNDAAAPVTDPMRTRTTRDTEAVVVPPFLMRHYTPRGQLAQMSTSVDAPSPTLTAATTPGFIVPPFIAELRGGGSDARAATDPLATVTAAGNHHGLTVPSSWTAWAAVYSYVNASVRPTGDPLPTQTTVLGEALLSGDGIPDVMDCLFRMLEPREVAAAMAFPGTYVVLGNKREQVRLAGNAVCPPNARDLVHMVVEALTGEEVAA